LRIAILNRDLLALDILMSLSSRRKPRSDSASRNRLSEAALGALYANFEAGGAEAIERFMVRALVRGAEWTGDRVAERLIAVFRELPNTAIYFPPQGRIRTFSPD
jgi:hypothetical protein